MAPLSPAYRRARTIRRHPAVEAMEERNMVSDSFLSALSAGYAATRPTIGAGDGAEVQAIRATPRREAIAPATPPAQAARPLAPQGRSGAAAPTVAVADRPARSSGAGDWLRFVGDSGAPALITLSTPAKVVSGASSAGPPEYHGAITPFRAPAPSFSVRTLAAPDADGGGVMTASSVPQGSGGSGGTSGGSGGMVLVSISATDASASEKLTTETPDPGEFTVQRSGDTTNALTVNYTVNASSTATAGSDYTALTGSVTIAAGATTAKIPVNVIDDQLIEDPETVTVTLSSSTNYTPSGGTTATVTIADNDTVDLQLMKTDGTPLSEAQEETPGGYVPLNNDDDDYDSIVDMSDTDGVVGENDTVPLVMKPIANPVAGDVFTLTFDTSKLNIYKGGTGGYKVQSGVTTFVANGTHTLQVEGIGGSASQADASIIMSLVNGQAVKRTDRVNVTVYTVTGPTNVPEYSIHTYKAVIPGGGTGSWTATNGAVQSGASSNTSTIKWGAGPAVGLATFSPAAGFKVDRDVNIVQVKVEAPTVGAAFTKGTPADAGTGTWINIMSKFVTSGSPGLAWKAKVTLAGPNGDRGVKEMRVGFIQNLTAYVCRGTFTTAGTTLKCNIETLTPLLDHVDTTAGPWYDDVGASVFFNPSSTNKVKEISSSDTPTDGPPLTADQGPTIAATDDILDSMLLQDTFQLDICVKTVDTANGADQVYTRRATASWSFNGDGTVGQAAPYAWTPGAAAKITAPTAWSPVTDGSQPPRTAGRTFNQELKAETFAP